MTKTLRALLEQLEKGKNEVRSMLKENKVQEAELRMIDLRDLQAKVDEQRKLEGEELDSLTGGRCLNDDFQAEPAAGEVRSLGLEQRMSDLAEPFVMDGEKRQLSVGKYVKGLVTGNWEGAIAEQRAMSEGVLSSGGYMVPVSLSSSIIDAARNQTRVFQAGALTVPMDTNKLTMARVLDGPSVHWKKENDRITESGVSFDAINFEAKTLVGMVRMSIELLEDAANIDRVVQDVLAQALALELDRAALFGNGTSPEPLGLFNTPGIQTIDMGANGADIGYSVFSQAVEQIESVNGSANGIIWSPRSAGAIDRLVDASGQPLQPPESFKNLKKYSTNQVPNDMTKGTAENASVAFVGDWSKLLIGMRKSITMEVSRQAEDVFGRLQALIRVYLRADVGVAKPDQFVVVDGITPKVPTV